VKEVRGQVQGLEPEPELGQGLRLRLRMEVLTVLVQLQVLVDCGEEGQRCRGRMVAVPQVG